ILDSLDRDFAFDIGIEGKVHAAKSAVSQLLFDRVLTDARYHCDLGRNSDPNIRHTPELGSGYHVRARVRPPTRVRGDTRWLSRSALESWISNWSPSCIPGLRSSEDSEMLT